jgi:hypothetical protein
MDSLKMVLNKEKEYFNGRMDKSIKVNGQKEKKMEVEFGKAAKEKAISDNGKMAWFKALVFIFQKMAIDMRDNLKIHKNMVWVHKDSQMDRLMLDIIKRTDQMVKVNTSGQMEITIKDIFPIVFDMDRATLNKIKQVKYLKVNTEMIKNADTDN